MPISTLSPKWPVVTGAVIAQRPFETTARHCLLTLLLTASIDANTDIYRWTDDEGQVHYGDSNAEVPASAEKTTLPRVDNTIPPPLPEAEVPISPPPDNSDNTASNFGDNDTDPVDAGTDTTTDPVADTGTDTDPGSDNTTQPVANTQPTQPASNTA